jgi:(E)-4-hydroxy-3-methylbut-2-enyl-diphosphate synthase
MDLSFKYCERLFSYKRVQTIEVQVGNVGVGGENPIRLQSMATTDSMDTTASVEQAIRMIKKGCEIVRFTAPSIKEAENLKIIREKLLAKGYDTPLVADIHFTPNAAEIAANNVEKIRINPGNYSDRNKARITEYTNEYFAKEVDKIRSKLLPLLHLCRKKNRALRIGVNHGSLSDRMMNRYGDTVRGMVESALEFIKICEENNFNQLIISLKSSNPRVMVMANRLLMAKMIKNGAIYPLHIGVTEAGEGEDGRIKSAIGIGALLEDGIGDTIRVSLTEKPENELPVAKLLVERFLNRTGEAARSDHDLPYNPFEYERRKTLPVLNIGGNNVPVVVADLCYLKKLQAVDLMHYGYQYQLKGDFWTVQEQAVDYLFTGNVVVDFPLPPGLKIICNWDKWEEKKGCFPLFTPKAYLKANKKSKTLNFIGITADNVGVITGLLNVLMADNTAVLLVHSSSKKGVYAVRRFFMELMHLKVDIPMIINYQYKEMREEPFLLHASVDFGSHLLDGMGDGLMISAQENISPQLLTTTAFGILQATRTRISKTEYISCPSCGRTQFNLQETTAQIREKTNHLKGLKIAVMGCIVNGPGEMADADYGYVGAGKGRINLYKKKELIARNVPVEKALDELVGLIRAGGDWIDRKES